MKNEFLAISDGTFTLSETENKNQFYFYRNDGGLLTDIHVDPIEWYKTYIIHKMMNCKITNIVMNNIYSEMSDDGKYIRLTIFNIGEDLTENKNSTVEKKQPNFLKRLFQKIFR